MDSTSSVALGRRTVDSIWRKASRFATLAALALAGLGWGSLAWAQSCDFVAVGATSALSPAGSNVTFTVEAQTTLCAPSVDVTFAVDLGDGTGGAFVVAPAAVTLAPDTPYTFTVTLGPNPGASGTVTATCVTGACAGNDVVFDFTTNNEFVYVATPAATVVTNQISTFALATDLELNNAPGTLSTSFANLTAPGTPTIVAPVGGVATLGGQAIFAAGTYNFAGSLQCPTLFVLEGCAAVAPVLFTVDVEPVSLTAVTPLAPGTPSGTPLAMTVAYGSPSLPAPDGTPITWSITAEPPGGDGAVTSPAITGGQSTASFSATAPGVYTVSANSGCTFCAVASQTFSITVSAVPALAIATGDGQTALPGNAFALPLRVVAEDSGVAVAGVGIDWVLTGDATLVPGGLTDANGEATATVTAGLTPGPLVVTATRQDAPTETVTFNLVVGALGTLEVVSGDTQTLLANTPSEPLVVLLADANGEPIVGATVNWTTSAGTLASATSATDANGEASNTVTLAIAGAVDVTASSPLAAAPATFSISGALVNLTGLDPTGIEVAGALDNSCQALATLAAPTPEQQDLLARCEELKLAATIDPPSVVAAIDQLMVEVALVQADAAFLSAQSQFQNLKTRIAALRAGTQGSSFGGLAINTAQGPLSLGLLSTALSDGGNPAEVGADFSRWGFFAAGNVGRAEARAGQVDPAWDNDIEGLTAGVDYRWSDRWIVGGSLGMTRQDTELPDGRGGLETRGWSVSGYGTWYTPGSWYLDGVLTWGRNNYDMLRRIRYTVPLPGGGSSSIDQVARSDSSGNLFSGALTFGRDFNQGAWGFGPYGRLLYTRLDFDPVTETLEAGPGSGLGLQIRSRQLDSLASVLGGKLTYTHSAAWGVLMPHLQLEWEHEFRDDPQAIEARFIHDPTATPIVISGDELDTDYFRLGLGMSMVFTGGRSAFFYYERLVGKDRTSQYNVALGLRMEF